MSRVSEYRSIVISDLHVRAGHGDDFKFDRQLADLLDWAARDGRTEIVLNGDIFDFVAMWPGSGDHPSPALGFTEADSVARLTAIALEHPLFFDALKRFIADGRRCVFIPGNHDWELHFPAVRQKLAALLGNPGREWLQFVLGGRPYKPVPGLHIEHGHQIVDDQNIFHHPQTPILTDPLGGPDRIEQSVGNWLVRCLVNPIERYFPFINNVKPFMKVDWFESIGGRTIKLMAALAEGTRGALRDPRIPGRIQALVMSSPPIRNILGPVRTPLSLLRPEHVLPPIAHALNDDSTESLRQAARRHLQVFGQTRFVVMGHSHELVNHDHEVNRYFGRHGRGYLNPGTWNPCIHVEEDAPALSLDKLCHGEDFPYRIAFVGIEGDARADLEARVEVFDEGAVWLTAA